MTKRQFQFMNKTQKKQLFERQIIAFYDLY